MIYPVKVMLVVCMRGQEKGVPCVGCFSCAFGSFFRIRFSYKKNTKTQGSKRYARRKTEAQTHTLTERRSSQYPAPLPAAK